MDDFISVVVPNFNGSSTIGKCLEAALRSNYDRYEVIVVDDASTDNSVEVINRFPCRLIRLEHHAGAAVARNTGARASSGEIIFFIDADCLVSENTLSLVRDAVAGRQDTVIGGSYTPLPFDDNFFSVFQSISINYFELKRKEPDYIASHSMVMEKRVFEKSGGFPETFLPIIEDVEFSHRLRRSGYRLLMAPDVLVRHIFNFSFLKSLRNAFRKSHYWTMYSLKNRDVFKDSGTASQELKVNVLSGFLVALLLPPCIIWANSIYLLLPFLLVALNLYVNRNLLRAFYRTKGAGFALAAALYYTLIYPLAVGAGSLTGIIHYYRNSVRGNT